VRWPGNLLQAESLGPTARIGEAVKWHRIFWTQKLFTEQALKFGDKTIEYNAQDKALPIQYLCSQVANISTTRWSLRERADSGA
jgi:hypothetical protein